MYSVRTDQSLVQIVIYQLKEMTLYSILLQRITTHGLTMRECCCEGVSLNTYTASESGDYTVVVLNQAGCESQCNGYIEVSSVIESQEKGWEWTDDRTLSTTQIQTYSFKLFNSSGILIHSKEGNSSSIEIPEIQSGIYLVSIIDQTTSKPQVIKFQR